MNVPSEQHPVMALVGQALKLARAGEVLVACIGHLKSLAEELTRLHEIDGELLPEVRAALKSVEEMSDTLVRAAVVVDARYDAARARLNEGEDTDGA